MGAYKISSTMELFAILAFLGILASKSLFMTLLLFGKVGWFANLRETMGSDITYLYAFLLVLILTSIGFMAYILITPLRSSSLELDMERGMLESKEKLVIISDENHEYEANVSCPNLLDSSFDTIQGYHESKQDQNSPFSSVSQIVQSVVDNVFTEESKDVIFLQNNGLVGSIEERAKLERVSLPRNDQVVGSFKSIDSLTISVSTVEGKSMADGLTVRDGRRKDPTSGLGPAGRQQLASILDEFWGILFDYHGKQTEEAKDVSAASLFDLDFEFQKATTEQSGPKSPVDGPLSQSVTMLGAKENSDFMGPAFPPALHLIGSPPENGSGLSHGNDLEGQISFVTYAAVQLEDTPWLGECFFVPSDKLFSGNKSDILSGCKETHKHIESTLELKVFETRRIINSQHKALKPPPVTVDFDGIWTRPYFCFRPAIKTWCGKKLYSSSGGTISFISWDMGKCLVLHSLRSCIRKLLIVDTSGWLFSQGGGSDEKLIDYFAELVKDGLCEIAEDMRNAAGDPIMVLPIVPGCGTEYCIWQVGLVVCFGAWCVHRILDLLLVESQPELWGKYAFVLNRLQGILFPAFCKERKFKILPCKCLRDADASSITKDTPCAPSTSSKHILELMTNAEVAISERKDRLVTGAGNVAFPHGNDLESAFERYRHHLTKPHPPPRPKPWAKTFPAYPN